MVERSECLAFEADGGGCEMTGASDKKPGAQMHKKHLGAYHELLAALWLLEQGYEVVKQVATYARLCDDDTLRRLAGRVERQRAAWKSSHIVVATP